MNYYISDTHFGHGAALNFDQRPFDNADEMDDYMIRAWNSRCDKNSQIYILGDFAFRNEKPFCWYLKQLKGQKHLIVGNHDTKLLKDSEAMTYFVSVDRYLEISDCKKHIVLCHYPIAEWNGFYRGGYHIYGHIHGKTDGTFQYMKKFDNALNAAAVINNYMPVTFEELIENNRIFKERIEPAGA